jgi:hypothetical protein
MKKRVPAAVILFLASLLLPACGGSTASTNGKSFDVVLKATSDDGEPLQGVRFASGSSPIGTSSAKGTVSVNMKGSDGQSLPITTTCPDGFVGPEQPSTLKLTEVRRVNQEGPATLGIEVTCTRKLREIVLVVRTTNATSLPVDVGGKTVGTTDENGNAHVRMQLDREVRSLSVSLGTTDSPALRPQNPSRVYELDGQDAILLVDQSFTIDRKVITKRRVASSTPRAKHIPYKIDSGRSRGF